MKILFICGSAEQGRDGLGDYSRRICAALIRRGTPAAILSINDPYVTDVREEIQTIDDTPVETVRLPATMGWEERKAPARAFVDKWNPDWISLQFVLFAFQPKGLPFNIADWLYSINGHHRWHIMFHEIWLGLNKGAELKFRLWGKTQKYIVGQVIEKLKPASISTQCSVYKAYLQALGCTVNLLPLISNIPQTGQKAYHKDSHEVVIVLFGTIQKDGNIHAFARYLKQYEATTGKKIKIIFCGRNGGEWPLWESTLKDNQIAYQVYGEQSPEMISRLLNSADYGLCTTPYYLLEKSGVFTAYALHALPVIVLSSDWEPDKKIQPENLQEEHISIFKSAGSFSFPRQQPEDRQAEGADDMLNRLTDLYLTIFEKSDTGPNTPGTFNVVVSHPTGNENVRAIAEGFYHAHTLRNFYTSIASFDTGFMASMGKIQAFRELNRRRFAPFLKPYIKTFPWNELARVVANRLHFTSLVAPEVGLYSIDQIYRRFDGHVAHALKYLNRKTPVTAIYAYEDGALESFRVAKKLGIQCIYDLPIAYWETVRRLLLEEAQRLPEWSKTLGGGIMDSTRKLARKSEEMELADIVITPSSFVQNSLPHKIDGTAQRSVLSPFGSPKAPEPLKKPHDGKLKVLFVGSMGQRKGLGDLFQAMKMVNSKNVELIVLGSLLDDISFYRKEYPHFTYLAPRAHDEVLHLMSSCDIFCLPSIVEGRALVTQEAMSQGLPIIITENTGGRDLVKEDTGFLVPIQSPESIADKIDWAAANRNQLPEMGMAAYRHSQTYTWEKYFEKIFQFIQ